MRSIFLKAIQSKHLSWLLWIFISYLSPILIAGYHYDFLNRRTTFQIFAPLGIIILVLLIKFWREIGESAKTMKEGIGREISVSIIRLGPFILFYLLGLFIDILHGDFMYVATLLLSTQALGLLFRANFMRIKRKQLMERGYVNVLK